MNRLLAVVGLGALMACGGGDSTATPSGPTSLQIEEITVGTGATAAVGDTVTVNYVGSFLDGRAKRLGRILSSATRIVSS